MTRFELARVLTGRSLVLPASTEAWRLFVDRARDERVGPLLYQALQTPGLREASPEKTMRELRSLYYNTAGLNVCLYDELFRLLGALGSEDVVLLKGAALATTLYSSVGLRPMSDLDLLVRRERVAESVAALRALGYRESSPESAPGLSDEVHYHVALHGGRHGEVAVEIHWSLIGGETDWRAPSIDWFWSRTEPWAYSSSERTLRAKQLDPTAHLLYLAAHLMLQHGARESRLLWFYDVHLLVERWGDRVDWDALRAGAREFHWSAALRRTLESAQEFFGTTLPSDCLDLLAETDDRRAQRLLASKNDPETPRGAVIWNELRCLDWKGRLKLTRSILLPSRHYVRWRYRPNPSWLWPLFYLYRWGIVLREAARAVHAQVDRR